MTNWIVLPQVGANDDEVQVVRWLKAAGDHVRKGDALCEVETTKAILTIEAQAEGYLNPLAREGEFRKVGSAIGALGEAPGEKVDWTAFQPVMGSIANSVTAQGETRWTKKAELLAKRHHLSLHELERAFASGTIGEAQVTSFLERKPSRGAQATTSVSAAGAQDAVERVMILGSASGGGSALIIDALAGLPRQRAVGILDRDVGWHGNTILGVPVLGSSDRAEEFWKEGLFDALVIAFNASLKERRAVFEDLRRRGIPFTNVIDMTASVRQGVTLGTGNVILTHSYVGTQTVIGDNNFLSSNTHIEHDCVVGSHCGFGPSVSFSGRVRVGDSVRFGTQIAIEPEVILGDDVVVASGVILNRGMQVPPGSMVKARIEYAIRPRRE